MLTLITPFLDDLIFEIKKKYVVIINMPNKTAQN